MPAYNGRGSAYIALEQYDLAIANYAKAIKIDPDNKEYYYKYWKCQKKMESYL